MSIKRIKKIQYKKNLSRNSQLLEKCNFLKKTKIQDILTKTMNFNELITDSIFQKNLTELKNIVKRVKENKFNIQKKPHLKKHFKVITHEYKFRFYTNTNL